MDSIIDRIRRSYAQRGVIATIRLCAETLFGFVHPAFRRAEAQRRAADADFDRRYGVDTGGVYRPKADEVVGNNWSLGGNYQAVLPAEFLAALNEVAIPHEQFTFIDFGSGKGRTLLLASTLPFKRIIGVEYCRELNAIARENFKHFPASEKRCDQLEAIDADATEFPIPPDPVLVFMNHPFAETVMAQVARNVAESFRKNPRRIVVIYLYPHHDHLWDATGFLKRLKTKPAVFDSGEIQAATGTVEPTARMTDQGPREFAKAA